MWRDANSPDPVFTDSLALDLGDVEPSLAGPKRPQDSVPTLKNADSIKAIVPSKRSVLVEGANYALRRRGGHRGHYLVRSTSNPSVLVATRVAGAQGD